MKFRSEKVSRLPSKIEIPMTPMIDIVFQLLAFFIMTFDVVSVEGDFSVKMPPSAAQEASPLDPLVSTIRVRMPANDDGELQGIFIEDQSFKSFDELNLYLRNLVGDDRGPGSATETQEIELDCDYHLKYRYAMEAITAASGFLSQDNQVVKLFEKIKFSPVKKN